MGQRSTGRGTAAVFGLLVLLAGLVGAAVLFYTSQQRPDQAIDEYARAPVGCTTTLEFTDTGTFYVFEEMGPEAAATLGECEPSADPDAAFRFVLSDESGAVEGQGDLGIAYDTGDRQGQSVASFVVDEPGRYEIEVVGDDPAVVAAIGRDPDDGVAELRRAALIVGGIGIALGGLLLLLSGRRSRRAAAGRTPEGARVWTRPDEPVDDRGERAVPHVPVSSPGSGEGGDGSAEPSTSPDTGMSWPPTPPTVSPTWESTAPVPTPPPATTEASEAPVANPWAAPAPGQRVEHLSPPPPPHGSSNGDDESRSDS